MLGAREARVAWHLKRGQKIYSYISQRELEALAKLGHLRPDDQLWRPGLARWQSPTTLPEVSPPPTTGRHRVRTARTLFWTRMSCLLSGIRNEFRRLRPFIRQRALTAKGRLRRAYSRAAAKWPNLIEVARSRPYQAILAGLFVIAAYASAIDFAAKSTFATSRAPIAKSLESKFQDRPSTELDTRVALKPTIDPAADVFSLSNGHPSGGSIRASKATSVAQAEPAQAVKPTPASQSEVAATSDQVPLPTRKPDKPSVTSALKRTVRHQKARQPRQIQFGVIGYNYTPQR
jgi:hypothetical protein